MRWRSAWLAAPLAAGLALAGCGRTAPQDAGHPGTSPPAAAGLPGAEQPGDGTRAQAPAVESAEAAEPVVRFAAGTAAPAPGLPRDIARGLATDDRVLDCAQGLVDGRSAFTSDWVAAHRIDLDGDGTRDWLVEGRDPCLRDAAGADWWLYAEGAVGRRLLMAAGRAAAVDVLPSRSHGLRDLRLVGDDGTTVVARFDGAAYVRAAASD